MDLESKNYSWEYVIADKCLTESECELVYACLVPSAATTDSALYNGRSTSGKKIIDLKDAVVANGEFNPSVPVYCPNGLYVDVGTSVTGIFVMWRNL